jgi:hypothetical protein
LPVSARLLADTTMSGIGLLLRSGQPDRVLAKLLIIALKRTGS